MALGKCEGWKHPHFSTGNAFIKHSVEKTPTRRARALRALASEEPSARERQDIISFIRDDGAVISFKTRSIGTEGWKIMDEVLQTEASLYIHEVKV